MVIHAGSYVRMVVNAACADKDISWLAAHLTGFKISRLQRALVATGPAAAKAVEQMVSLPEEVHFLQVAVSEFDGQQIELSRSGYTGEDGFEVSLPETVAKGFVIRLIENEGAQMAGLVARDSLRLEAGLCLYGQDMDEDISAVTASLHWSVPKIRRAGGARRAALLAQMLRWQSWLPAARNAG